MTNALNLLLWNVEFMVEKVSFCKEVKHLEMILVKKWEVLSGIQLYNSFLNNFFMILDQFHENRIHVLIGFE